MASSLDAKARDQVVRTILAEAGNEPPEGQAAVANVIKNRVDSGAWGDPLKGGVSRVIYAPSQFSAWNQNPRMQAYAASINAIPTTDPRYQRAGQIADAVFSEQYADNTGGATHYYAPSGMPGGQPPDWALGQNGRIIGSQRFYKLPLTASNTAGTAVTSPSTVGTGTQPTAPLDALGDNKPQAQQAVNVALADAKTMLGKNEVPNHDEIMSYLHDGGQDLDPHKAAWCAAFVSASLQKAGLPVPTQVVQGSAYGAGAWAPNYQTYGSAVDPNNIQAGDILVANNGHHVGFAEGPIRQGSNGPEVQMIAGNEADTSGQYASGVNRAQVGMVGERWVPLSEYSARRYEPAAEGAASADANKPAPQAQSVAAVAPPGSAPLPGSPQNPPVASPGAPDPNARFQVLQTMGEGGRPGLPYTALNLAPGAGSTPPAAPAAAAPAVTTARPDLTQRTPLDQTPTPPPRPTDLTPAAPTPAPARAPAASIASVMPNFGASASYPNGPGTPTTGAFLPGSGGRFPAATAGAPSMGYPALGADTPSAPMASMPSPVFASAQNLLKLLFPTG